MTEKRNVKPYEELEFTDGFMFRKIMITYPEICRELLELILGKKIRSLKLVDYEKTVGEYYDSPAISMFSETVLARVEEKHTWGAPT